MLRKTFNVIGVGSITLVLAWAVVWGKNPWLACAAGVLLVMFGIIWRRGE